MVRLLFIQSLHNLSGQFQWKSAPFEIRGGRSCRFWLGTVLGSQWPAAAQRPLGTHVAYAGRRAATSSQ